MSNQAKLCTPLPGHLTSDITICENSEQHVVNFLQDQLPPSDCKSISEELRKTFILDKFKVKHKSKPKNHKGTSIRRNIRFKLGKIGDNSQIKYSDLLPLNQMWLLYIREMLGEQAFTSILSPHDPYFEYFTRQLIKADFHGAKISIPSSKCLSLVGLTGIIIQDTKNSFRICGTDNIIRTIPKNVVKIYFYVSDGIIIKAFGKQLCIRPVERTVKKFKNPRIVAQL